jgi:hypothetical protein
MKPMPDQNWSAWAYLVCSALFRAPSRSLLNFEQKESGYDRD